MSLQLTPKKAGPSPRKSPIAPKSPLGIPKHKLTLPELSRTRNGLRAALVKSLEAAMNRLDVIWTDIGLGEEQKCARTKVVFEHLQSMLDDMANEEESCRTKLRESMQEHLEDYAKYCAELKMDMVQIDESCTLLEKEQMLRSQCGDLAKEKHSRLKKLRGLIAEESQLCTSLCRPTTLPSNSDGPCPTLKQLEEWQETVDNLAREQKRRLKDLVDARKRLEDLWNELESGPSDEFEEQLSSCSTTKLELTDSTQSRAEQLCAECEKKLTEKIQIADHLRERLRPLWERLKVEATEQEDFLSQHQGCRQSTIQSMQDEVARLEELRRLNIGSFVLSVREELNLLWDQCQFGPKQRQNFWPAFSDDFSEELLAEHEQELDRLKAFASENNSIYQLVEKRDKLWQRLQEILANANNPDRLSNRGGRLLKEEKMRKQISKELPKVEREIQVAIQEWETTHQQPFLVNDARYLDAIESQWDSHEQKKEAEKAKRQQVKKAMTDQELKFGSRAITPLKRKTTAQGGASAGAGSGAAKRKLAAAASAPVGRKPLAASNTTTASSFKVAASRTPVKAAAHPPGMATRSGRENLASVEGTFLALCSSQAAHT